MATFDEIQNLLNTLGRNQVTAIAYDTAWIASLRSPQDPNRPAFPETLEWINTHQHNDGSWGAPWPYYHDRLISTLRAILTLRSWGRRAADAQRIERGLSYIWRNAERRSHDPWETVAFETVFPTLLLAAEREGFRLPYQAFADVVSVRRAKLAQVPPRAYYDRRTPVPVTLESLGDDFDSAQATDLQETIGCVGMSPAATAYLLSKLPDNTTARKYVAEAIAATGEGGASTYFPLETFEYSWTLFMLQHEQVLPDLYQGRLRSLTQPMLDFLLETQQPTGWTSSRYSSVKEADTTGVCFSILARAGYSLNPQILYQFEEPDHFRVYPFERNSSSSAHAHLLTAFSSLSSQDREPGVSKILRFLKHSQRPTGFWFDKWHVSPFYATSHVVLAAAAIDQELVQPAVDWLLHTQWAGGAWGYYGPTMEESAYALLALIFAQSKGYRVPPTVLKRGADYLIQNFSPAQVDYPPLWIGKALYTEVVAVKAAILAALWAWESL